MRIHIAVCIAYRHDTRIYVLLQVKRNVLDVTHQVSQYQNIISELKDEIGRLKTKITVQVIIRLGADVHKRVVFPFSYFT